MRTGRSSSSMLIASAWTFMSAGSASRRSKAMLIVRMLSGIVSKVSTILFLFSSCALVAYFD